MKKILYSIIVAGLALVSAACQKVDEKSPANGSDALTVTASIVNFDGTKVSYAFTETGNSKSGIKPSWVIGDAIFGFDDKGGTFSFTVSSITDGKAEFNTGEYAPVEGTKLYAVYYPGKSVSDLENNALSVDLSSQSGKLDGSAPVIMCATGEIKNNTVNFNFVNQTAIVGIYKMQVFNDGEPVGADKTVTSVKLKGAVVNGTIKVKDGVLTLEAGTTTADLTADVDFSTEEDGYVNVNSDPIAPYFAVIPKAEVSLSIEATCGDNTCATNAAITGKINAGQYYYLGKKVYGGTVATIGLDQQFATISEAFAAATDGDEIQLQNDCTFDSQITLAGKSGEITLDLNGHTLKNGPTLNGKQSRFYLNTGATLVIRDSQNDGGTITSDKVDQDIIRIIKGNLEVASGTIEAPSGGTVGGNAAIWVEPATSGTTTDASVTIQGTANIQGPAYFAEEVENKRAYALYVDNPGAAITVSGGTFSAQSNSMRIMDAKSVDITGGTFVCDNAEFAMRFAVTAGKTYTCNISGDATSVTSKSRAVYANGEGLTLNISGGKFKTTGTGAIILAETGEGANLPKMNITGGLYSKAPNSDYVADNYVCLNNTDQATKGDYPKQVKVFSAVATLTVGSGQAQEFASVEDAVAEANKEENKETACTITLTAPSTVGAQAVISNTAGVTLDLNDQTLTFGGTDRIYVAENAKLTIVDNGTNHNGTILQSAKASNTISLTNAGSSLTISGGKITCAEGQTAATVYVTNGTLNMDGGEITGIKVGISMDSVEESAPEVTVSGNAKVTSTGSNAIVPGAGKLTIEGGYFKASAAVIYTTSTSITNYVASGGYYNKALNESYITVKEGYVCVSEPDDSRPGYDYVVKEFSAVATLTVGSTSTDFASVEDAVTEANKATQACTITLTASSTVGAAATVTNSYGVTLDLNGKTLTHDEKKRIGLSGSGKLTIVDNGTGGTITQTAAGSSTLTFSSGTLTIEGGTITKDEGATFNTINVSGGKLYVTGGTITNNASGCATIAVTSGTSTSGTAEISGGEVTSSGQYAISVNGTGDLTVKGTAKVKSTASRAIDVSGSGKLSVSDSAELKSTVGSAVCVADGGNLTMTGGSIIAETTTTTSVGITIPKATEGKKVIVSISGGNVTSNISNGISATSGKLTITGGNFAGRLKNGSTTAAAAIYKSNTSTAEIEISGGYFSTKPADAMLKSGYRSVENQDETYAYKVEKVPTVATLTVGSTVTNHTSIEAAVEAANDADQACTITLEEQTTVGAAATVTNSAGVTLDLNGKILTTITLGVRIGVSGSGKLTIKDSQTGGKITATVGTQVISCSSGELILENGTIEGYLNYYPVNVTGSCEFTINGGNVNSPSGLAIMLNGSDAKVTLIDGEISGSRVGNGAVTVNAGSFEVRGGSITSASKMAVAVKGAAACNIYGGSISTSATDTSAIWVNHDNATVTVNGEDVTITAPNHVYNSSTAITGTRSIVTVDKGSFKLINGTIGNSNNTGTDGNMTAVKVTDGIFDMQGGYLYARHHALVFQGKSASNVLSKISDGCLTTINSGWTLIRFQPESNNKLQIDGGGFSLEQGKYAIFAGQKTQTTIPTTATVTINKGYFGNTPNVNWGDGVWETVIGSHELINSGPYSYDGKDYNYKVE